MTDLERARTAMAVAAMFSTPSDIGDRGKHANIDASYLDKTNNALVRREIKLPDVAK
jgi:hypothetical protein